jgi:preprotein translocase subunit SecD
MRQLLLVFALMAAQPGCSSRSTPTKIPPGTTLEIYTIAASKAANTTEAVDPVSGDPLYLQSPPILTTTDIATVARSEIEIQSEDGTRSGRTQTALTFELTPAGSAQMSAATATPMRQPLAIVIGGQVVATPRLFSPIEGSFEISGIDPRFSSTVDALTSP